MHGDSTSGEQHEEFATALCGHDRFFEPNPFGRRPSPTFSPVETTAASGERTADFGRHDARQKAGPIRRRDVVKFDTACRDGGKNDEPIDKLKLHRATRASEPHDAPWGEVPLSLREGSLLRVEFVGATAGDVRRTLGDADGMCARGIRVRCETRVTIEPHGSGTEQAAFAIDQFEG